MGESGGPTRCRTRAELKRRNPGGIGSGSAAGKEVVYHKVYVKLRKKLGEK